MIRFGHMNVPDARGLTFLQLLHFVCGLQAIMAVQLAEMQRRERGEY